MSNGTMRRKHISQSCCLHDNNHAGKPVLSLLAHFVPQECAYYYYRCPAAQASLGWVCRGTRVLNNLYVEHVFRRSMRNARTSDLAQGQVLKQL